MVPGRLRPQQDEGDAVRWRNEHVEDEDFQGGNRAVRIVWKTNVDAVNVCSFSLD